eukprot:TRINITY_DN11388_c0_g1_i2.p1 TRINITY_DN11388_c0_g1~~TRINITY_DN11388_c0_g1_i2.p1  ORF type:complete len:444 (+),score=112.94 TRINITY_DN11388_c0_g1_i2:116-1447(+)
MCGSGLAIAPITSFGQGQQVLLSAPWRGAPASSVPPTRNAAPGARIDFKFLSSFALADALLLSLRPGEELTLRCTEAPFSAELRLQVERPADCSVVSGARHTWLRVLREHPTIAPGQCFHVVWTRAQLLATMLWALGSWLGAVRRWVPGVLQQGDAAHLVDNADLVAILEQTVDFQAAEPSLSHRQLAHSVETCLRFKSRDEVSAEEVDAAVHQIAARFYDASVSSSASDLATVAGQYQPAPASTSATQLQEWECRLVQVLAPGLHRAAANSAAQHGVGWDPRVLHTDEWEQLGGMAQGLVLHHVAQRIKALKVLGWAVARSKSTPNCLTAQAQSAHELQRTTEAASRAIDTPCTNKRPSRRQAVDLRMVAQSAQDAHDRWALHRKAMGWSYSSKQSDDLRTHPLLLPFQSLPASTQQQHLTNTLVLAHAMKRVGCSIVQCVD